MKRSDLENPEVNLSQALKTAFDRAKNEHGISRRAIAQAVYAIENAAYQLRKKNAPLRAVSALPPGPKSVHSWENLFLRWIANDCFPIEKEIKVVLATLDSLAPGSIDHQSPRNWERMWQAGPPTRQAGVAASSKLNSRRELQENSESVPEGEAIMGDHINVGAHGSATIRSTITNSTVGSGAASSNQHRRFTQEFIFDLREKVETTGDEVAIYAVDILDVELQKPLPSRETILKTIPKIQRAIPSIKQDPGLAVVLDGIVDPAAI